MFYFTCLILFCVYLFSLADLLNAYIEALGPQAVFSVLYKTVAGHSNPKVIAETVNYMINAVTVRPPCVHCRDCVLVCDCARALSTVALFLVVDVVGRRSVG